MSFYLEENNKLYNNFLKDYFYEDFKKEDGIKNLELIVSPKCNLKCSYCYLHKNKKRIFPNDIYNEEQIKKNLKKILNWIDKNNYKMDLDIFSGELFAQKIGYEILEIIYNWCKNTNNRPKQITIPTNFTFILSEEYTKKVEDFIEKFSNLGVGLHLSASFDGKFCENNRSYKHDLDINFFNKERDEDYYDRIFIFNKKHNIGLHPMIWSEHIEDWKDNFLWFQEKFKKHELRWDHLYLLQVRDKEWTDEQIKYFSEFIYFLLEFSYKKEKENLIEWIFSSSGFNILSQPFRHSGKGLSCAIQTSLPIRLTDMKVFPCHRLSYSGFEIGQYIDDINEGLIFKTKNTSLGLTIYGIDKKSQPVCHKCKINNLCTGGCLGSQYETNGSMFIPIQSVCKLNYILVCTIIKFLKDKKMLAKIYNYVEKDVALQIKMLEELI